MRGCRCWRRHNRQPARRPSADGLPPSFSALAANCRPRTTFKTTQQRLKLRLGILSRTARPLSSAISELLSSLLRLSIGPLRRDSACSLPADFLRQCDFLEDCLRSTQLIQGLPFASAPSYLFYGSTLHFRMLPYGSTWPILGFLPFDGDSSVSCPKNENITEMYCNMIAPIPTTTSRPLLAEHPFVKGSTIIARVA